MPDCAEEVLGFYFLAGKIDNPHSTKMTALADSYHGIKRLHETRRELINAIKLD